ncbi:MAG: response regulator [Methanobacteriota archaeon]|nr:MAG: response regulator [Euryarchaeota archaeon]
MAKVLIVEDEESQRLLYEAEISEMGHDVLLACDGVEAVDKVREHKPDVVILDLMMPNMHGLDALRKVLSLNPTIPVIIHTAYSHYRDNFMSWAAEEYIVKSSDLTDLKKAISRVLSARMSMN